MDILGKSATEIINLINKKEIKVEEVFAYFLKRIKKYNPQLNAYLTEAKYKKNNSTGLLSGLPIAAKDNFCTEGLKTTASSKVLDQFTPPYDSTVTKKIKEKGGLILGKTNMDAWAHGSSTETSDYGATKNPWDQTRSPGGSSGGSAAAVASYIAPIAIGSETAGSIKQPSAWSGIVGLKPTYGRVSRYGVIAMGSSLDCPGPMSLNTEDSALLLQAIAGHDPHDATSSTEAVPDYNKEMKKNHQFTVGVADEYFEGLEDSLKEKINQGLEVLKKLGHKIKKVKLIHPKYAISVYTIVQRAEVSSNLSRYDGIRYGNDRHCLGDEAKRRIMLGTYTLSYGYYDAYYKKAQKVRTLIIDDFKKAFKEVDVIYAPTTPVTALKLGEFEKYPFFGELMDILNEPGAISGIPSINIPVGLDKNGLPVGAQIMANYFNESAILDLAYQFEKETNFFDVTKKILEKYK